MKYRFKVDDMSCNHCKMTIEKALQELEDIESYNVDLEKKEVLVESDGDAQEIIDKIRERGYSPELVQP